MPLPRFAVVSAVHNVASYLPDFLDSLDSQRYPRDLLRVVLVDDGSQDASLELCTSWAARTDLDAQVLHQENKGQGEARNFGLEHIGDVDWISFADPDDFLDEDYFANLAAFAQSHADAVLLSSNQIDFVEQDPAQRTRHPLRYRFNGGDQLVDLDNFPRYFQLGAAAACLRADLLQASGVKFDGRVKPNFEDGHLIARFLLEQDHPLVGFVATARYYYRRRADGSSTLQRAKADPRRYMDVLEYGYLDILRQAARTRMTAPQWLQNIVIYELSWIFRSEDAMFGGTAQMPPLVTDRFHELVVECRSYLEDSVVSSFQLTGRSAPQREALLHGYANEAWHWASVYVDAIDADNPLVRLIYHYAGEAPKEDILFRGRKIQPMHSKTRDFVYLRRPLIHERILWVRCDGELRIDLGGAPVPLTAKWPAPEPLAVRPAQLRRLRQPSKRYTPEPVQSLTRKHRLYSAVRSALSAARGASKNQRTELSRPSQAADSRVRHAAIERLRSSGGLDVRKDESASVKTAKREERESAKASRLAATPRMRRRFHDAWVLMDRSFTAHDNAEHLFRHLRTERPDINAWFVVKEGTPDWDRLQSEGLGDRLIGHGSMMWRILCLNATHVISSHADRYVYDPFPRKDGWNWRYTFLQHGVTKDDISRWLNSKTIDGMVTATAQEYASIVGDGSGYKLTTKETALTGFPRFDRLASLAADRDASGGPRTIVFMPTWRQYLAGEQIPGTGERRRNENFPLSDFAVNWSRVLNSSTIRRAAEENGIRLLFMPHPNLETYIGDFQLPSWIAATTYGASDVQEVLADAALLVTDYSSVAFDAAFAARPVLYFQFDREQVFGGGHITRPGYFSYDLHGFGPVARDAQQAIDLSSGLIGQSGKLAEPYRSRVQETFTMPRHGACERVTAMIEDHSRHLNAKQLRRTVPTPTAPVIPGIG